MQIRMFDVYFILGNYSESRVKSGVDTIVLSLLGYCLKVVYSLISFLESLLSL